MPKRQTRDDYAHRIIRVVDHIADHLDTPLDLDRLAEIACFSRWHFHRIYRGVLGETPDQTVRRLRLHRAATALVETDAPMTRIASGAGYASLEAFSRAFSASYGHPPSTYRAARRGPAEADRVRARQEESSPMHDVVIEDMPILRAVGCDHRGPYSEINRAFAQLAAWAGPYGLIEPETLFLAVYYDDPDSVAPDALRSFAAMTLSDSQSAALGDLDDGFRAEELPAGPVARLRHVGPYAELPSVYRHLYGEWLPGSGREPADRPSFEIYRNSPVNTAPTDLITDIYMPLSA